MHPLHHNPLCRVPLVLMNNVLSIPWWQTGTSYVSHFSKQYTKICLTSYIDKVKKYIYIIFKFRKRSVTQLVKLRHKATWLGSGNNWRSFVSYEMQSPVSISCSMSMYYKISVIFFFLFLSFFFVNNFNFQLYCKLCQFVNLPVNHWAVFVRP